MKYPTSRNGIVVAVFVLALTLCPGCSSDRQDNPASGVREPSNRIVAASYALQYLTSRIAGAECQVDCPLEPTGNAMQWSPKPEQIIAMQKADLIVINGQGAEYAKWILQTTLSPSRICESCEDIPLKDLISVPDYRIVHSHGPEGEHSHPYMVPYTWLDPVMAIKQSEKIAECLSRIYPECAAEFQGNLNELTRDLQAIHAGNADSGKPAGISISLNPYLKYFTRSAGLADEHLLWFDLPNASNWDEVKQELDQKISENDVDFVLASQPLPAFLEEFLSDRNLTVVPIDTLDHPPGEGDLIAALQSNFDRVNR